MDSSLGEGGGKNLVEQQQDTEAIAPPTPSSNEENPSASSPNPQSPIPQSVTNAIASPPPSTKPTSVDHTPTLVTVGNQLKMKPQDLIGKAVKHQDGTIYRCDAVDWRGKLICSAIDTGKQAFLILSDLQ